jgi:hypothetical protein
MKLTNSLLTSTMMTPAERRMGRFMRAPDGHEGGDSGAPANNTGVNSDSGTPAGDSNTGQDFDFGAFWNQQKQDDASDDSKKDEPDEGAQLGQQLVSQIQGFKASDVFTQDALQKMTDGDLSPLNEGINKAVQMSMTQMLGITATLMQKFEQNLQSRFDSMVENRLETSRTSQQDEQMLSKEFKAFSDPAVRPMIHGVFRQALQHSAGDRQKALKLTRGMLQTMGTVAKDDMGLSSLRNPDDQLDEGPARLVQELLQGRS